MALHWLLIPNCLLIEPECIHEITPHIAYDIYQHFVLLEIHYVHKVLVNPLVKLAKEKVW